MTPEEYLKEKSFPVCICPDCGDTTNYIEEYEKHYCPECNADVEPIMKKVNYHVDALVAVQMKEKEMLEKFKKGLI